MTPDERPNGHAHARAMALQASTTLAVIAGKVQLGTWQRIFLVDLDGPRSREVVVTTAGCLGALWPEGPVPCGAMPKLVQDPV